MGNDTKQARTVIVTGSSKGIGKSIAEKFAEEGNTVLLCARNEATLAQAALDISKKYPQASIKTFVADLSQKVEVLAFATWCLQQGTPMILVNNAGVYLPGNASNEPEGHLEKMMNTNLYSAYHLTQALLPSMMQEAEGHIFNICSIASLQAYQGGGSYSISKFAMNGFSQNLRLELKQSGIKVTAVFPGAVLTDSWGDFDNSAKRIMEASDVAAMVLAASKLSAQAVVEEIVLRPQLGDL
jgi:short-subunit dehydrogenase